MVVRIVLIWFHRRDGTGVEKLRKSNATDGSEGTGHVAAARLPEALPYEAKPTHKVPRLHGSYLCRPLPRRCRAAGACAPLR
jgi:hypothetical protein